MASRIDNFAEMARVFHSLGNKTRLRIMTLLLVEGEMNVTSIYKKLKLSQTVVSGHLRLLRLGGMVQTRRDRRQMFYSLTDLSKHRLGEKSELTKAKSNAAKFGPAELVLLQTARQSDKLGEISRVFHSLGNKTRLSIMTLLAKGEMNVMTLCKKLKLPQSSVSFHLGFLREGDLVATRRDGHCVFYSLADLTKHRLGSKSESAKRGVNAAKFGPAELILPKT
jgi:DNA-binding transcriptional ArsR family regulator